MSPKSIPDPLAQRALPAGRQIRVLLVIIVVLCATVAVAWAFARRDSGEPSGGASTRAPDPNSVKLTRAQLSTLRIEPVSAHAFRTEQLTDGRITLNGDTTTQIFSPYSGRVLRVLASPGEHVSKGAPLIEVEAAEFAQTLADLRNSSAALKLARTNEARKHAAFDSKGGSLQDWQQSQSDLAAAEATHTLARNRMRIFGKTDAEITALETGTVADAKTLVAAPIEGIVTDRQVGPGQYIQSGSSTPVFTIGDISTVWLVARVREIDAPLVKLGATIEVRVLALPGEVFKAKLTSIAAEIDPVTRRVAVRATIPNPQGRLRPQMFATFAIRVGDDSTAPAVPEDAVVREGDKAHVWVVAGDDALTLRPIRTGRVSDGLVEVLEGLREGERVVTRGSLFIDRAAQPG